MSAPVLVYDGDCGFCMRSLRLLRRTVPEWPESRAWQAIDLGAHGLTREQVTRAAWWVEPGRPPVGGAEAFAALLRWQPSGRWRLLGRGLSTPPVSWIAAPVYAVVARWRQRLPGGTPMCSIHRDL
ncbi:DUF393 domain-containing protein [Planotetraspora sp. A-T 1434]|uniref:thiol-disulfide oxidoreductase DCC family protein n=1 Tax=Planotetraspora sp. A-T 1434 TaxID=2979219 RepID=UPI0021C09EC0|nr:DUF393 domain-containing protein [Planotetraspora sp. A-T 1434]MCT9928953.1 DUF393 domain-containing protein [Planotetraspora sp. A-T 1434]